MSEWHVGQTGGTSNRAGLTASLMLRFGGEAASVADPTTAKGVRSPETESFSSILRDRTGRSTETPRHAGYKRVSVDKAQAPNRTAAGDKPEDLSARVTAQNASSRQAASVSGNTEKTTTGSTPAEPVSEDRSGPISPDVGKPVPAAGEEREPTAEASAASVLAMLLQAMQTVLEDLSGQAASSAVETEETASVAGLGMEQAGDAISQVQQELRQWLQAAVSRLEAEGSPMPVSLPEPLRDMLAKLLEQLEAKPEGAVDPVAATDETKGALIAQLQALTQGLRQMLQHQGRQADDTMRVPSPEELDSDDTGLAEADGLNDSGAVRDTSELTDRKPATLPPAFAVAHQGNEAGEDVAAMARGTGVHEAAVAGGRSFGQEVAQAARTSGPAPSQAAFAPETARSVTQQVTTRLQTVSGDERHEMELQLKPESLGKIQLRIVEERGQILAKFTAESERVRAILESNMQLLRDALEKNGMQIQELSVSVGQRQAQQSREEAAELPRGDQAGPLGLRMRADSAGEGIPGSGAGVRLSQRVREYLYGPESTMSLKA